MHRRPGQRPGPDPAGALADLGPPKIDFLLPHGTWLNPPPGRHPRPASAAEIATIVRVIVPYRPPDPGNLNINISSPQAFGTMAMSWQPDDCSSRRPSSTRRSTSNYARCSISSPWPGRTTANVTTRHGAPTRVRLAACSRAPARSLASAASPACALVFADSHRLTAGALILRSAGPHGFRDTVREVKPAGQGGSELVTVERDAIVTRFAVLEVFPTVTLRYSLVTCSCALRRGGTRTAAPSATCSWSRTSGTRRRSRSRMRVVHSFGREDRLDRAAVERLAGSLGRLWLEPCRGPPRSWPLRRVGRLRRGPTCWTSCGSGWGSARS